MPSRCTGVVAAACTQGKCTQHGKPQDVVSREDILAYAYAQCRSNKGAPGVDGQDFADIEAYGVERWLGELALALRKETYRPEPIRRVFIPKANGKLRPLGISTVRDRVCMTVPFPRDG
jgi:RNA-directed DNA polymerase